MVSSAYHSLPLLGNQRTSFEAVSRIEALEFIISTFKGIETNTDESRLFTPLSVVKGGFKMVFSVVEVAAAAPAGSL